MMDMAEHGHSVPSPAAYRRLPSIPSRPIRSGTGELRVHRPGRPTGSLSESLSLRCNAAGSEKSPQEGSGLLRSRRALEPRCNAPEYRPEQPTCASPSWAGLPVRLYLLYKNFDYA